MMLQGYVSLVLLTVLPALVRIITSVYPVSIQTPRWSRENVFEKIMHTWIVRTLCSVYFVTLIDRHAQERTKTNVLLEMKL